jgi:hypothetical protein
MKYRIAGWLATSTIGLAIGALGIAMACGSPPNPAPAPPQSKWKFDGTVAWDSLVKQVNFGPRVPGTPPQEKCKDYLLAELKKGCDDAHIQHLTHRWTYNNKVVDVYNVIGTQNWKDAKVRVVLLAHWDSRPWSDGPNSPDYQKKPLPYRPIPGADDGASGVAVLLELAQAIKDRHPDVGILYLLDDAEDLGPSMEEMLLGVDYFAKNLPSPKPDYGILLDMIGKKDMVVGEEQESLKYAEKLTKAFFANAGEVGLGKTFPATMADDIEDDHWPLIQHGIPTLDLIDFNYDQWHTQDDTPAHCSKESLVATGIALESFLLRNPPFKP